MPERNADGEVAFSKSLAREMARYEVTVNAVCLGPTSESTEPPVGISLEGWNSFMRLIPFRRPARPAEVAALVAFLATRDARCITGRPSASPAAWSWLEVPAASLRGVVRNAG